MTVVFYFPSHSVGGSEMLFARIAVELVRMGHHIWLADFPDGFISEYLMNYNVPFRHLKCSDLGLVDVPSGADVLVITNFAFLKLDYISTVDKHLKLVVWEVHKCFWSFSVSCHRLKAKIFRVFMQRVCQRLVDEYALFVLEKDSRDTIVAIGLKQVDRVGLVPIPVEIPEERLNQQGRFKIKTVASIGRAVDWKIIPVAWAFDVLAKNGLCDRFIFLTDNKATASGLWEEFATSFKYNVEFIEGLQSKALDEFMLEEVGLFIGMGTSVLEAAKLGIPSVIIDSGTAPYLNDARVRLLSDNALENLGAPEPSRVKGWDLCKLASMIIEDYSLYSNEAFTYVQKYHSITVVGESCYRGLLKAKLPFLAMRNSIFMRCIKFLRRANNIFTNS